MMTDSTELLVFAATFEKISPDPFTQPNKPCSADAEDSTVVEGLREGALLPSLSVTNSNSDDSLEGLDVMILAFVQTLSNCVKIYLQNGERMCLQCNDVGASKQALTTHGLAQLTLTAVQLDLIYFSTYENE